MTHRATPTDVSFPGTPSHKRFALVGPSHAFDPRVDAARGDLADARLADRLFAPHYAVAVLRSVVRDAPLLTSVGGQPLSEIRVGEAFEVLELSREHAWGASPVDGAVGFVPIDALGAFSDADLPEVAPVDDFVTVAEDLIGTPAVAGGRSSAGTDAGGLLFYAFSRAGIRVPRFVDLQATIGHSVGEDAPMLRGDLIFFGDAVGIVTGADHVITVSDTVERVAIAALGDIAARRRLP